MTWEYVMFFYPQIRIQIKKDTKFVDEFRIFNKKSIKLQKKSTVIFFKI